MPRPREPAQVLEMRGAFDANPQRRRVDPEGAGPFNPEPPPHLPEESVRAWRYLVDRLPRVALYSTDEVAVEIAARLLSALWIGDKSAEPRLYAWLSKLGMTPADRANLATSVRKKDDGKFGKFA